MAQIPLAGRFTDAVHYAAVAHHGHLRKGTEIPYLSHLLSVAALVLEHGGTELQATAGLLHDVVEDCGGAPRLEDVRRTFGEEVAELVAALSDSLTEEGEEKDEWRPRKEAYLRHLETMVANEHPAALVSLCDKLHNAHAIVADAADDQDGPGTEIWSRFTGGVDGTVWYYRELVRIFGISRLPARAIRALSETVDELARHAGTAGSGSGAERLTGTEKGVNA
jgi:(p)ppGpp synthase/HD superfamily hydrolase